MVQGTVFEIRQLAVHDGPGIRTTVFLKGCPLRCSWCHNPEGLSFAPQLMVSANGCTGCGRCRAVCPHPEGCVACGACVTACPLGLRRMAGSSWTAQALADRLLRDADYVGGGGGGFTFSGGEPTAQSAFLLETLDRLLGSHRAIETSGHCPPSVFAEVLQRVEYVMLDLKGMDPAAHRAHTGQENGLILTNLDALAASGLPFVVRVPLIPGVTDTDENLEHTAQRLHGMERLERVELLPYHVTAGAKYEPAGLDYKPTFDPDRPPRADREPFLRRGIACVVL